MCSHSSRTVIESDSSPVPCRRSTRRQNSIVFCYFLNRITKCVGAEQSSQGDGGVMPLTRMPVEETGFIARDIEFRILLIDLLVAIYPILFRVVPHGVVPPIEQWLGFGLIDGITVAVAGKIPDQSGRHIIDLTIPFQRIEHNEQTRLMVVEFIESCVEIRLYRKEILGPPKVIRTA